MGVDQLRRDLETLAYRKLVDEQRKKQITRTISLATISQIELARFRQTGITTLTTLEEWFERDFPRLYLRLIKGVSVNVAALVPPLEGIKATLTHLGTSRTLLPRGGAYEAVEIPREPESVALSSPLGATGVFLPLLPESEQLNPFEGNGVESGWLLELPKSANPGLNYDTIVDVQLVVQYTALEDSAKRPVHPLTARGAVSLSARLSFPDPYYHFHNPDFFAATYGTGAGQTPEPYRLRFTVDERRFPPNQRGRRLTGVVLLLEGAAAAGKRPLTTLRCVPLAGGTPVEVWRDQVTPASGLRRVEGPGLPPVAGVWELSLLRDPTEWARLVGAHLGLTGPVDPLDPGAGPFTLFDWQDVGGHPEPRRVNGRVVLDVSWLTDALLMLEYEYLPA
jgi:hypothetical protein